MTILGGKVCQAITGTVSAACYTVYGPKLTQMNDLTNAINRQIVEESTQYGLSTLHC